MNARSFVLLVAWLIPGPWNVALPGEYVPPQLRHVNYLALDIPQGETLVCRVLCMPNGLYPHALVCRLVRPDGFEEARAGAEPGADTTIQVPVTWKGRCALETNSGWNLNTVRFPRPTPHAYISRRDRPLKTVRAWGPLYFYVPKGTRYFNVFIHASVKREGLHFTLRNPDGQVVREEDGDFDKRTKIQVVASKCRGLWQDGAAWSIEISKPHAKGLVLDDVYVELGRHLPPFLSPRPEWARRFAGDWRYSPPAAKPRRRLAAAPAKVKPFRGLRTPAVQEAYERRGGDAWATSLPFTYVLDYGSKHLGNPAYVKAVGSAPPALLHLGKDVPFNHGWGPIRALGGENQAYGWGAYIERLSPAQVRARIEGLRGMVDALHKAGVRWVTPYICAMTLNGDEKKRTGFWEFYDHWNEYRSLGLGPRPAADPFEWLQRLPDGRPRLYYRYNYPKEYYPRFRTNHRYAACWRSNGWRTWLCEVVRFAARCGYDGVFVDNAVSQRCLCRRCLAAFRRFLKQRYTGARGRRMFGGRPLDELTFETKPGSPLHVATNRFWSETLRDEMATLKRAGSLVLGRDFIVFPNGGRPAFIQAGLRDADFVMFEMSVGEYGTHPGMALCPVFDGLKMRAWNDHVFEYKFVESLRRRVRPVVLSRAGYPRRAPWLMLNPNAARLGLAECAAFSGGGGFLLRPRFDVYHDALTTYRRFFEQHPRLYAGLTPYASLGVLAWPEQGWFGNRFHLRRVKEATKALTEAHVLFDYVPESGLQPQRLREYDTLAAVDVKFVTEEQLAVLERWVRDGGKLVVVGEFGTRDEAMQERRNTAGLRARAAECEPGQVRPFGRGAVARCADLLDLPRVSAKVAGRPLSVLSGSDPRLAAHVKVNAYCTRGGDPARLVVHVVNYNVPLGVEAGPPEEVKGLVLDLPIPGAARVESVKCYVPGGSEIPLRADAAGRRVRIRLPRLHIYRVVEIQLSTRPNDPAAK